MDIVVHGKAAWVLTPWMAHLIVHGNYKYIWELEVIDFQNCVIFEYKKFKIINDPGNFLRKLLPA